MADVRLREIVRQPVAWLPIAISLAQLAMIAWALGSGVVSAGDEGAPARVFQALLVVEALIILAFAVRWLPRAPAQALIVLGAQLVIGVIPVAAILVLEA